MKKRKFIYITVLMLFIVALIPMATTSAATEIYNGPAIVGIKQSPMYSGFVAQQPPNWLYMGPYIAHVKHNGVLGMASVPTFIDYKTNKMVYSLRNYVDDVTARGYTKEGWRAFEYNSDGSIGNVSTYITYQPASAIPQVQGKVGFRAGYSDPNHLKLLEYPSSQYSGLYASDMYAVELDYEIPQKIGGQVCIGTQIICNTDDEGRLWSGNNVMGLGTATYPNLVVGDARISTDKQEYYEGENITVTVTVLNDGDFNSRPLGEHPSGISNKIGLTLTANGNTYFSKDENMDGIAKNGGTATYTFNITAPSVSANTSFNLWAKADRYDNNVELKENDNVGNKAITIKPNNNLTMMSVVTDKQTYEAEENGTATAVVKNTGGNTLTNIPVRLTVSPSNSFTITSPNKTINRLAPGESVNVTWNIKSGALTADTTSTFTATVDPENIIPETNENDNSATNNAVAERLKPDLVVESVLTNKEPDKVFEAGEIIVITATVRNIGKANAGANTLQLSQIAPDSMQLEGFDQSQAPENNPYFEVEIGSLAPGAGTSVTWRFVNPIRVEARNVDATATADVYNVVDELREDNNTNTIKLTLNPGKPDFTPVWHNVVNNQIFKAGYEAIISAKIRNIGKISSDGVNIRLHLNGKDYADKIDIPTATPNYPTGFHSAGGNIASFRVRMPSVAGTYTMTVTADPTDIVPEELENNNVATIRIVVQEETTPPVIDVIDPGTIPEPPDIPYTDTTFWEEIRKKGDKEYEVRSYYATLTQEFIMMPASYVAREETPNEIESGFGLEGFTITKIDTNYDRPNLIVGAQIVRTYYPETNYGDPPFAGYHEKLQAVAGGNDFMRKWIMKINPLSVKGYSVHYTPKWFPDGDYKALSYAISGYTPAGQLSSVAVNGDVEIVGDMYDRVTSGNR